MKKLMIAAAIVCAAAFVQAGTVNWAVANVQASPAGAIVASTTTYSAWLFVGDDVSAVTALLTGKAEDMASFAAAALAGDNNPRDAVATSKGLISFGAKGTGSFSNTEVSAFAIILDTSVANMANAKNYLVAKVDGTGDEVITKTFTATGNQNFTWGNQEKNTGWTAVAPEPTTGLLMLLGMGALALRRRRA